MAPNRAWPVALGLTAIIGTIALVVLHISLVLAMAKPSSPLSAVMVLAIISVALEAAVLGCLGWCLVMFLMTSPRDRTRGPNTVLFGVETALCTVAAITSIVALVLLSKATDNLPDKIIGSSPVSFLIGTSVALGLSYAAQLVYLVVHFIIARLPGGDASSSIASEEGTRTPQAHVKSVPYSQTSPAETKARTDTSTDSRSPPGSSGGRSTAETMSSIRSSLSNAVRPISSKTRLLSASQKSPQSQRTIRRPASLDSSALRSNVNSTTSEEGFDSWDTSSVDPQNRQTVLETSSPLMSTAGRFLETIPASPTTSRSPSPGTPLDLEPPKTRRRSRSYSPASHRIKPQRSMTASSQQGSPTTGEAHIHPLFRSDSPTPPPAVSAGTIVTASPQAGQVISDRQSIRTVSRMRSSSSLPAVPSPLALSRNGSYDDLAMRRAQREHSPIPDTPSTMMSTVTTTADEEDKETKEKSLVERKLTPPIPEWILTAGSRTSLSDYHSRKSRTEEGSDAGQMGLAL